MWKKFLLLAGLLVFGVSQGVGATPVDMQEGLWEVTTRVEIPGIQVAIPPVTMTQCITQEDLIPPSEQPNSECKVTNHQIKGNTVTWSMVCLGEEGKIQGDGQITYHGDRFEGTVKMSLPEGMTMTNHMSGHRIGVCK